MPIINTLHLTYVCYFTVILIHCLVKFDLTCGTQNSSHMLCGHLIPDVNPFDYREQCSSNQKSCDVIG